MAIPRATRLRFAPDIIAALNNIAWWDWPIDWIVASDATIVGADLTALQKAFNG